MDWIVTLVLCLIAICIVWWCFRRSTKNWVVVDGSNVLYWDGETPNFRSVESVIDILKQEGFLPVVWFDANVGYLIGDRYVGPSALADRLELPRRRVFVAPKGTPADPLLIKNAKALKASVITNDRFRDWEESFPFIRQNGFLIRGYITEDQILLELGE